VYIFFKKNKGTIFKLREQNYRLSKIEKLKLQLNLFKMVPTFNGALLKRAHPKKTEEMKFERVRKNGKWSELIFYKNCVTRLACKLLYWKNIY